jgi:hypothetical protein
VGRARDAEIELLFRAHFVPLSRGLAFSAGSLDAASDAVQDAIDPIASGQTTLWWQWSADRQGEWQWVSCPLEQQAIDLVRGFTSPPTVP